MASRYDLRSIVVQTLFEIDFTNQFNSENSLSILKSILRRNFNEQTLGQEDFDVVPMSEIKDVPEFATKLALGVLAKKDTLDEILKKAAPEWGIEKIDITNRNILRLGIYELLFGEEMGTPKKVAINEAIEMAKAFGGESSRRFINGVLANIYKDLESAETKK